MTYAAPFPDSTIPTGGRFKDLTPPRTAFHRGTDYSKYKGARGAIPSVCGGVVVNRGWSTIVGWWVEIRSTEGDDMYWTYCHMAAPTPLAVGAVVHVRDTVGAVGATGSAARGDHLHLAGSPVRGGGLSAPVSRLVDPHAYIAARSAGFAGGGGTTLNPEEDDMPSPITHADAQLLLTEPIIVEARWGGQASVAEVLAGTRSRAEDTYLQVNALTAAVAALAGATGIPAAQIADIISAEVKAKLASDFQAIQNVVVGAVDGLSDAEVAALAKAVADEQDRRSRLRLGN